MTGKNWNDTPETLQKRVIEPLISAAARAADAADNQMNASGRWKTGTEKHRKKLARTNIARFDANVAAIDQLGWDLTQSWGAAEWIKARIEQIRLWAAE